MRCYYCPKCNGYEVVSDEVEEMKHVNCRGFLGEIPVSMGSIRFCLTIQEAINFLGFSPKLITLELLEKVLTTIKFEIDKKYLLLIDPTMIDIEEFSKMKWWESLDLPEILIVPVRIPVGKDINQAIIMKDQAFEIQDWLMKAFERVDE